MPASNHRTPRIAVLADSDTRWKWGALTAGRLAPEGATTDGYLLRGRATPTERQLAEVGLRPDALAEVPLAGFLAELRRRHADAAAPYDLVVLALVGGAVQAALHGLARLGQDHGVRPVVVTGYVGVVYEKLADGLLLRHGADLVLANSAVDAERFRAVYEGVGADSTAVTEAALPFLGGAPHRPADSGDRPYTVVFAAQPSVPAGRADRAHLLDRLIGHARAHPDREVLLKLRSKPGEHTTHLEEIPYQRLARDRGPLPENFRLVHGNMGEVLDRTDLLVTVSSTAALESLHRSIPTAVLTDLGVREALGNHHFIGSGCLTSFDRLDEGHTPVADPTWQDRNGVAPGTAYASAFDTARARTAALLKLAGAEELPPITPYYTPRTAPGYLPGLLGRHHLAPDGTPLPGALDPAPAEGLRGRARTAVNGAVRGAARAAYRHGVQNVAPLVRRLGRL
ncbi:DUF6716 putative glycosyltransferase [Streptomyces albidoflavus]|uniref:DUF6716 putative glycosyltransferase n=1 Tax=Streptomyces TaxID=1883 RepID=UPI00101E6F2F|nr:MULTISPECIES: DUF6716 putative glycosyltransferase [Streptomyces]RZD63418.1 hypothetical protein C0Q57_20600 [Streptomyces albidoflavus]RZE89885.1 hypothetical protein C0R04_20385 [Streptomyces albidoflavus]RZE91566.1 hypothetical protein C0R03_20400 [Streptomyces albidoflavus]UKL06115.1 hypothetical protein L2I08_25700 [Streptomyces sp. NBU3104]